MRFRNFSFLSSRSNIDDMISLPRFSNFRFCFPIPKELSNFAHQSLDKFLLSGDSMDHSFQLLPVSRDCNNFTRSSAFVRREVRKNSRRWARLLFGREKLSVNGMKNCVLSFSSRIYTSRIKHYLPLYLISFVPWIPLSYVFVWIEWSWWSYFEVLKWMAMLN